MALVRPISLLMSGAAVVAIALFAARVARSEIRVSAIVGDHMVVQQGRPVRLVGTAAPGEEIRASFGTSGPKAAVPAGIATTSATSKADGAGHWSITLPARPAGGPFVLTIEGSNTLKFTDIWSGELWLAAGQSNMELPLARSFGSDQAVAGGCAGLRLFVIMQTTAFAPSTDVQGTWQTCDATSAASFSATAFHFGREIQRALGVPVGLIESAWGGTSAEAWTPRSALVAEPSLKPMVDASDQIIQDPARRKEIAQALADWEAKNFHQDEGNRGEPLGYARTGGGGKDWSTMAIPQMWENAGLAIDGAVWFRREVVLPPEWAGQELALSLGALDDFDTTYWNGEQVGATGAQTPQYWSAPRHYKIPPRLARAGRNVIAVRVFDQGGDGGFAGTAAQLFVAAPGAEPLPLAGKWFYKIERGLSPIVVDWGARPHVVGLDDPSTPSVLWNAMVAPLAGLPLAGVLWYQGESNVGRADEYRTLFPAMIRAWRTAWASPALPFLFVQLPNFANPAAGTAPLGSGGWAGLREAQTAALHLQRTAMAVTLDIGESGNIHPRNKQEVGRRLALAALRTVYGKDVIASGPVFLSAMREGHAMRVRFASIASGLATSDGAPPAGFLVAGADRAWHRANARIEGDSVIVSCPDVPEPLAVRYGWADDPINTLRSLAAFPAAPFRTDNW
jgi:sialate O-acetylesterase